MMNTIFFIKKDYKIYMGFLKTLFTGKRDELTAEEMSQYEEFHKNEGEDYQLVDDDSHLANSEITLKDVLNYLETLNSSELIKIKNKIAQVEENINSDSFTQNSSYDDEELENDRDDDKISYNSEEVESGNETFNENVVNNIYDDEDDFEIVDESSIYSQTTVDNNENDDKNSTSSSNSNDDEYVEIGDVNISNMKPKNNDTFLDEDDSSHDDPALFSVIHDELMELFEDGQVILLKEEFSFPSLGVRDTLAFGIFNNSISQISEQTHWFIQHLKQFSRLKECKMLLSEENEKDLILDINDKYAILICFKTSNLVKEEFVFNRKWD